MANAKPVKEKKTSTTPSVNKAAIQRARTAANKAKHVAKAAADAQKKAAHRKAYEQRKADKRAISAMNLDFVPPDSANDGEQVQAQAA